MAEVKADVQIHIEPADVNEAISRAVLESTLGLQVAEAVQLFCKKAARAPEYDPVGTAVREFLAKTIQDMLCGEPYVSQIRDAVRVELDKKLPELVAAIITKHVRGY